MPIAKRVFQVADNTSFLSMILSRETVSAGLIIPSQWSTVLAFSNYGDVFLSDQSNGFIRLSQHLCCCLLRRETSLCCLSTFEYHMSPSLHCTTPHTYCVRLSRQFSFIVATPMFVPYDSNRSSCFDPYLLRSSVPTLQLSTLILLASMVDHLSQLCSHHGSGHNPR